MMIWLLLLIPYCLVPGTFSTPPPDFETKIDEIAQAIVSCRDIVGLNVAIVEGETTILTKGYGKIDIDNNDPVTSTTRFGIASLTKAFATTGLASTMEDNPQYSWDSKTRDVFGEEFYFHDAERSIQSSLRDLAAHKMGLPPNNYARLQGNLTRDVLASKVRFYVPTRPYRESYWYNNLMYGLISYATEKVGGKSWEDTLQTKIFTPLGMESTSFSHVIDMNGPNIAKPYLYDDDHWRAVSFKLHSEWGSLGGSGSVVTSAEDMAKWLKFNLNNDGQSSIYSSILSPDKHKELHTPQNIIPESTSDTYYRRPFCPVSYMSPNYGMGWRIGSYRGLPMVMHTGSSWGYGAHLILIPDKKIGIYSSITGLDSGYHGRRALHMYAIDRLLGEEPWHNTTTACTYPDTQAMRAKKDDSTKNLYAQADLESYTGTYGNYGYGNITVVYNAGSESLQMSYGNLGQWFLHATSTQDEFTGEGIEDVWNMDLSGVKFIPTAGQYNEVSVYTLNTALPPVFERNLKLSSAPDPPELGCSTSSVAAWTAAPCFMAAVAAAIIAQFTYMYRACM